MNSQSRRVAGIVLIVFPYLGAVLLVGGLLTLGVGLLRVRRSPAGGAGMPPVATPAVVSHSRKEGQ